jgi:predicted O-methyltransferase YrrM
MESISTESSLNEWIHQLFEHPDLLRMGHAQRLQDDNLGLGWLYYAFGRILRPATAVVVGSYRGFVPMVLARALRDNAEQGHVHFIDPSLVDDFWRDETRVQDYLSGLGITNITHHLQTTQQFIESPTFSQLTNIGIVFIDGYHTAEQAEFDFDAFASRLSPQGILLFHDSVWAQRSGIYGPGRAYTHSVHHFIDNLKSRPEWQVLDLPFGDAVTVVRRAITPSFEDRNQSPGVVHYLAPKKSLLDVLTAQFPVPTANV